MASFDPFQALFCHLTGEWISPTHRHQTAEPPTTVEPTSDDKHTGLEAIREKASHCRGCALYETAQQTVFGDGSPHAPLVFVGEAPGEEEDNQGLPFVGRAGKLLTETLRKLGVPRTSVYICNILKHRPPGNRPPTIEETQACTPFLREQIDIIQPRLVVALGNSATQYLLNTEEKITRLRGQEHESILGCPVYPTFHPAAVLRNHTTYYPLFEADIHTALQRVGLCQK